MANLDSESADSESAPTRPDTSEPDAPDGLMNDQEMPTADGEMASNTSEEVEPPRSDRDASGH